jgi:hypothetical protein
MTLLEVPEQIGTVECHNVYFDDLSFEVSTTYITRKKFTINVKVSLWTPLRHVWMWRCSSAHLQLRHCLEWSVQLHGWAVLLPRKTPPVPIK